MPQKYHLIATGGAIMHNLALALHHQGHRVSGSDDEIYNPARDRLAAAGLLPPTEGWHPERITSDLDGVILGMHARPDNPELKKATELGLPIYSFPEFVYERSKNKRRTAICGSHGKTTTTSMILHVLHHYEQAIDYLVGAQLDGFERMVRLSEAPNIVIEGDEYLSSPIDRRPKFVHYRANLAVLTGIEWDHINVFPTYEDYLAQFDLLLESLAQNATLIYNEEDEEVVRVVARCRRTDLSFVPYHTLSWKPAPEGGTLTHFGSDSYALQIFGDHNFSNLAAAMEVGAQLGISKKDFLEAMTGFQGAARRLQEVYRSDALTVWNDFAHAPSKVRATVRAVRALHPERKLYAILELHTFSSLNRDFLPHYKQTLDAADEVVVFFNEHTLAIKKLPPLSPEIVASAFAHPALTVITDREKLATWLDERDLNDASLLMMSSGNFGGLQYDFKA